MTVLESCLASLDEEVTRNRRKIADLERQIALRERQRPWLERWSYDERRMMWRHEDGHAISDIAMMHGPGFYPFLQTYYKVHPEDNVK